MPQNHGKRRRSSIESQIDEFIENNPGIRKGVILEKAYVLQGVFRFHATSRNNPEIIGIYHLKIVLPFKFPSELPSVFEIGGKIPHLSNYHVNQSEGSLCLGSPMSLIRNIAENPTLLRFAEKCIVPYLYAVSLLIKYKIPWVHGELEHGLPGLVHEYSSIFRVNDPKQIYEILVLLSLKRRIANKKNCPCGCGLRFGKCKIGINANSYRCVGSRTFFKKTAVDYLSQVKSV